MSRQNRKEKTIVGAIHPDVLAYTAGKDVELDRALIEAYAHRMIDLFGSNGGGLIAKNYGDLHGIGVDPEWDQWAYDVFVEYG